MCYFLSMWLRASMFLLLQGCLVPASGGADPDATRLPRDRPAEAPRDSLIVDAHPTDAASDAPNEDAAADLRLQDAAPDASARDAEPDWSVVDLSIADASADQSLPDALADAASDAAPDAAPDALADAAPDAASDALADAAPEADQGLADASSTDLCPAGHQLVGEFARWCGKVNVHRGVGQAWVVDADCASGCGVGGLDYCRRFWPAAAVIVAADLSPEAKPFATAQCREVFMHRGIDQFGCCARLE